MFEQLGPGLHVRFNVSFQRKWLNSQPPLGLAPADNLTWVCLIALGYSKMSEKKQGKVAGITTRQLFYEAVHLRLEVST